MNKIKMSFKKAFLPITAAALILTVVSKLSDLLLNWLNENIPLTIQIGSRIMPINVNKLIISLLGFLIVSPFYIGLYAFLFHRTDGEKTDVKRIFDFYRSPKTFFKSALARCITMAVVMLVYPIFMLILYFFARGSSSIGAAVIIIILACIYFAFALIPYIYAKEPNERFSLTVEKSVKLCAKFFYVLIAEIIVILVLTAVYMKIMPDSPYSGRLDDSSAVFFSVISSLGSWILSTLTVWTDFTVAYIIFEKEKKDMLKDFFNKKNNAETDEEEPFIEPYDFFIEADERFHDEKVIETENIRGVDILAVLEEMDLAFDVVNHFGIRRKLKKMFDELSFEIGEYVSYEGGREIENDFTEEIDDRVFCVSVKISKGSDHEPFILVIHIDLEDE